MRSIRSVIVFFTCCLLLPAFAAQASILDQQNPATSFTISMGVGNSPGGSGEPNVAQSFTAGIAGVLDSVDVFVRRDLSLGVGLTTEIYSVAGGLPIGSPLASVTIPELSVPTTLSFLNVDLHSFGIPVDVGTQLAIVLHNSITNHNTIFATAGNSGSYAGGTLSIDTGGGFSSIGDYDLPFKTYVSAVPIPATIWLFCSGLVGLIRFCRRQAG